MMYLGKSKVISTAAWVIFAALAIWAFLPGLRSFFDPQDFITFLNPANHGTSYMDFLKGGWSWQNESGELIGFFRPLPSTMYLLEFSVFRANPFPYKSITFIIHVICSVLIMKTVHSMGGRKLVSMAAGMLFAVHPGTVRAVACIVTRPDVIATLFSIVAVHQVISLRRRRDFSMHALLPGLFTALSLAGKELGIANFFALPVMYFLWPVEGGKSADRRNTILFLASMVVVAVLFYLMRVWMFGDIGGYDSRPPLSNSVTWIKTIVLQATGIAYVARPLKYLIVLLQAGVLVLTVARRKLKGLWEVVLAVTVTGIYSFQSLLSYPEPHYVYSAAAFATMFLLYLFGALQLSWKHRAGVSAVALAVSLMVSILTTRHHSNQFSELTKPHELVFTGLESVAGNFSEMEPDTCYVHLFRGSTVGLEMKNTALYMDFLYDGECQFIFTEDAAPGHWAPAFVWNGETVELIR